VWQTLTQAGFTPARQQDLASPQVHAMAISRHCRAWATEQMTLRMRVSRWSKELLATIGVPGSFSSCCADQQVRSASEHGHDYRDDQYFKEARHVDFQLVKFTG
tara:strand:+ start:259 stop:570 length:312 start_codon:yes stop_codon:yes gene_type:complete